MRSPDMVLLIWAEGVEHENGDGAYLERDSTAVDREKKPNTRREKTQKRTAAL